jgi:hypothetical protein
MSVSSSPPDTDDAPMAEDFVTPVGVTIAYKRQQDGFVTPTRKLLPKEVTVPRAPKPPLGKNSAVQVFLESAALYLFCLMLPTTLAFVWRLYEEGFPWPTSLSHWLSSKTTLGASSMHHVYNTSDTSWSGTMYNNAAYYLCSTVPSDSTVHSYLASSWSWCPPSPPPIPTLSCVSPDAHSTDVPYVVLMSIALALIRIALVQCLVPLQTAERLEALVRCKSIHLLSSDYSASLTPRRDTPRTLRRRTSRHKMALVHTNDNDDIHDNPNDFDYYNVNEQTTTKRPGDLMMPALPDLGEARVEDNDDANNNNNSSTMGMRLDDSEECTTSDAFFQELSSKMQNSSTWEDEHGEALSVASYSSASPSRERLYAAPRYATALFRLLYCTAASSLAWYYFQTADFWPWYVGGHGATRNCWNLSGGLSVGMDSDFDHLNAVLRKYFLWQASYHGHSGAFHLISMLILYMSGNHRPKSVRTSTSAYVRTLAQHILALVMISLAYVFSSLRRLSAIGMFAFDVSSLFLHLLQVCINAPRPNPVLIRRLHQYCVIPSYCVARFGIWPALWYSMATESKQWLLQLERTLVPGSAGVMRIVVHTWMSLLMGFTVMYFRRLVYHPHLQRIYKRKERKMRL